MTNQSLFFLILSSTILFTIAQNCRISKQYTAQELYTNDFKRKEFINKIIAKEAIFMKTIGVNSAIGITYDGQQLDLEKGEPYGLPHEFTASSKESIHIALLAKALDGNTQAQLIYSVEEALEIVTLKISTFEAFAQEYPGFGGFLPWVQVSVDRIDPTWDFQDRVPSLDNGQLFWAAYGLAGVLTSKYPAYKGLAQRWTTFWETMAANALTIFHEGKGQIRTVTNIKDPKVPVSQNVYSNGSSDCDLPTSVCYLDDPYEGEMFTQMIYLFTNLDDETKEMMWAAKRKKLVPIDISLKGGKEMATIQKGWWFSAHEQWKYLFLPYNDVEINRKLFINGEKARTMDAALNYLPGMFASVTSSIKTDSQKFDYYSDCGIEYLAFQKVTHRQLVTPYSTMTLFLADEATATVWYHNMISGPAGESKYGSIEGILIDGTEISPMTTWDTKITTVLGMVGGMSDIISAQLRRDQLYVTFVKRVESEWTLAFKSTQYVYDTLNFYLPKVEIPMIKADFTTCSS